MIVMDSIRITINNIITTIITITTNIHTTSTQVHRHSHRHRTTHRPLVRTRLIAIRITLIKDKAEVSQVSPVNRVNQVAQAEQEALPEAEVTRRTAATTGARVTNGPAVEDMVEGMKELGAVAVPLAQLAPQERQVLRVGQELRAHREPREPQEPQGNQVRRALTVQEEQEEEGPAIATAEVGLPMAPQATAHHPTDLQRMAQHMGPSMALLRMAHPTARHPMGRQDLRDHTAVTTQCMFRHPRRDHPHLLRHHK